MFTLLAKDERGCDNRQHGSGRNQTGGRQRSKERAALVSGPLYEKRTKCLFGKDKRKKTGVCFGEGCNIRGDETARKKKAGLTEM